MISSAAVAFEAARALGAGQLDFAIIALQQAAAAQQAAVAVLQKASEGLSLQLAAQGLGQSVNRLA